MNLMLIMDQLGPGLVAVLFATFIVIGIAIAEIMFAFNQNDDVVIVDQSTEPLKHTSYIDLRKKDNKVWSKGISQEEFHYLADMLEYNEEYLRTGRLN